MTEKITTTTHQWQLLRRLEAGGCQLAWEYFAEPCEPLQIVQEPPALGTELFPLGGRTGLAFRLRIRSSVSFNISGIRLQADWITRSLTGVNYCQQHRKYCFHDCCNGEVRIESVLNNRLCKELPLKWGDLLSGCLALTLNEIVPASLGRQLPATLWFYDAFNRAYPYSVMINNSQQITGSGDGHCVFVSAAELEQEKADHLAAEAAKAQAEVQRKANPKTSPMMETINRIVDEMQCASDRRKAVREMTAT
jgi:hypothetical protein